MGAPGGLQRPEMAQSWWGSGSWGLSPRGSPASASSVDEVLQRVKEAEKALQQAREALTSFSELHRSGAGSGISSPRDNSKLEDNGHSPGSPRQSSTVDMEAEAKRMSAKEKAKCKNIFNSIDKDGSGTVSAVELKKMLELSDIPVKRDTFEELKRKMQLADDNADGRLNFQEFCKAFCFNKAQNEMDKKSAMSQLQKDALQSQEETMPTEQYVRIYGVQYAAVTRYLRKELDETSACLQLPQAFAIFICFFLSVTWHFDYARLHGVDQAITWDIRENANFAFSGILPFENGRMGHKNIDDVNTIADFWSWMSIGLTPVFWPQSWDVNEARTNVLMKCVGPRTVMSWWGGYGGLDGNFSNEGSPDFGGKCPDDGWVKVPQETTQFFSDDAGSYPDIRGTYLFYHRVIGGVRMRQERTPLVACPARVEGLRGSIFRGQCVGGQDYWLKPELHQGLSIDMSLVNRPGGETVHLMSRRSQTEIRTQLKGLEDRAWFSPQTSKIELLFTTYNVNEDLVTATYVMFFLNRGGHIHKIIEPVSFHIDPYGNGYGVWIADIAWATFCIKLFLEESWEIMKYWRQLGFRRGTWCYMSLGNFIDWVSIAVAVFLAVFWILHLERLEELRDSLLMASATTEGSFSTGAERDEFYDRVDGLVYDVHFLRTFLAVYPFVIVSRFFKAFSLQPRLAMVTNTLSKAAVDITHFVVVFATVFAIFGFSAMILWGQELEEFANEMRSLQTLFRILLGDFDWEQLHNVGRPQAYLWFWTFVWLVNMVLLNMLLAIIMDVYTDVKAGIGTGAETLWSQTAEIFRRSRAVWLGHSVALKKILTALDPTDLESDDGEEADEEMLYPRTLTERVPKMEEDQALQVLVASHKLKVSDERASDTLTDAMARISKIDARTMMMAEHISRFIQAQPLAHHDRHHSNASVVI